MHLIEKYKKNKESLKRIYDIEEEDVDAGIGSENAKLPLSQDDQQSNHSMFEFLEEKRLDKLGDTIFSETQLNESEREPITEKHLAIDFSNTK